MSKSIGIYIDRESQEEHELFEEVGQVVEPMSSQIKVLPSNIYTTKSGIKAQKLSDDLTSFKLNEIIVHKKSHNRVAGGI
jgi:hypothetical protein